MRSMLRREAHSATPSGLRTTGNRFTTAYGPRRTRARNDGRTALCVMPAAPLTVPNLRRGAGSGRASNAPPQPERDRWTRILLSMCRESTDVSVCMNERNASVSSSTSQTSNRSLIRRSPTGSFFVHSWRALETECVLKGGETNERRERALPPNSIEIPLFLAGPSTGDFFCLENIRRIGRAGTIRFRHAYTARDWEAARAAALPL